MKLEKLALQELLKTNGALTPGEVALIMRVDPRTVNRWSNEGRLPHYRTPGGHRRFPIRDLKEYFRLHHMDWPLDV